MTYYPTTPFQITAINAVAKEVVIHSDIQGYERDCLELAVQSYGFLVPFGVTLSGKGFAKLITGYCDNDQTQEIARILRAH